MSPDECTPDSVTSVAQPSLISAQISITGRQSNLDITVAACHPWDLEAFSPHLSPLSVKRTRYKLPAEKLLGFLPRVPAVAGKPALSFQLEEC